MLGRWLLPLVGLLLLLATSAGAVAVDKPLDDPAQEARARALHKQLRCLVCQNQSIEDSNAELARDLRAVVRERIAAGDDDKQVLDYVVARYGKWVLLKPPLDVGTLLLWFGPLVLLAGVALFLFLRLNGRMKARVAEVVLSEAEEREADRLIDRENKD